MSPPRVGISRPLPDRMLADTIGLRIPSRRCRLTPVPAGRSCCCRASGHSCAQRTLHLRASNAAASAIAADRDLGRRFRRAVHFIAPHLLNFLLCRAAVQPVRHLPRSIFMSICSHALTPLPGSAFGSSGAFVSRRDIGLGRRNLLRLIPSLPAIIIGLRSQRPAAFSAGVVADLCRGQRQQGVAAAVGLSSRLLCRRQLGALLPSWLGAWLAGSCYVSGDARAMVASSRPPGGGRVTKPRLAAGFQLSITSFHSGSREAASGMHTPVHRRENRGLWIPGLRLGSPRNTARLRRLRLEPAGGASVRGRALRRAAGGGWAPRLADTLTHRLLAVERSLISCAESV